MSDINPTQEQIKKLIKEKKDALLDWYENGPGPVGADAPPMPNPGVIGMEISSDQPKAPEPEKPVDVDKKLEQFGEMYKAMVLTKAIEKKLASFSYKKDEDDKDEAKSEAKALVKKLSDIVNGL